MKCNKKLCLKVLLMFMISLLGGCKHEEEVQKIDLAATAKWLQETVEEPMYGSVGGEWLILGLARSEETIPAEYFEKYYANLEASVLEYDGVLDERKYTEYSRVILALTAMGKDPSNVAGYDLFKPLANYEKTIFQGMNGPVFALLALDSGNYEMPQLKDEGIQADREMYLSYILENEADGGGWSLAGGEAEVDMTAMVLQALAKYQDREDVSKAIDRSLQVLYEQQTENGGYSSYGEESSEAIAQVIVALTELGINVQDERFVKNGKSLKDALFAFKNEEGAFSHTLEGEANLMATEQAFYAMVAMKRQEQGKSSLYRMTLDESEAGNKSEEQDCCSIEIRCETALEHLELLPEGKVAVLPENGIILVKKEVNFSEGETVFDILCRVCKEENIRLEYSWTPVYDSYYIEGINHLYEFDCGGKSGWMYQVNEQFPNIGCSTYEVKAGDAIVWCYTSEGLGVDVGAKME